MRSLTTVHSPFTMQIDLVGVSEIADYLQISRQQLHTYQQRPDFPQPVAELSCGRIWLLRDIRHWAELRGRKLPGRPASTL